MRVRLLVPIVATISYPNLYLKEDSDDLMLSADRHFDSLETFWPQLVTYFQLQAKQDASDRLDTGANLLCTLARNSHIS